MKKILIGLAVFLFISGYWILSNETEDTQTEIYFLNSCGSMTDADRVMRQIYTEFEEQNEDIKLRMISMPSDENVADKVKEMLTAGRLPNIIYTNGLENSDSLYPLLVSKNYLLDILPYIEDDSEWKENIPDQVFSSFMTEDGKMYTVNDRVRVCGYWYNVNMFENAGITELPETWDEFAEVCKKLNQWSASIKYDISSLHLNKETATCIARAYISEKEINAAYESTYSLEDSISMLKKISQYVSLEEDSFTYQENIRSLNIGQCAMYVGDISQENMMNSNINIAYAPLPSAYEGKINVSSATAGYLICNTGSEKQQEACIRFLKYMLSESVQERLLLEAGYIPINPNVNIEELISDNSRRYRNWSAMQAEATVGRVSESIFDFKETQTFENKVIPYLQKYKTK